MIEAKLRPIITIAIMAVIIMGVSIPLLLKKIPPNIYYGFRLPKTLSNKDIWYRANMMGAIYMIAASVFVLVVCLFLYLNKETLSFLDIHHASLASSVGSIAVAILASVIYIRRL